MVFEAVFTKKLKKQVIIKDSADVYKLVKQFAKSRQEQCIVVTLDGTRYVLGVHVVNIGYTDGTPVSIKDIFYKAIMDNATYIIVCHNHTGHLLEPSKTDLKFADRLYKAGTILDIIVKDQLVITEYGFSSIKSSTEAILKGEIRP
jgi:DNA repair protein RadC